MNQSSVIAGAVMTAFLIFVIVRGELPCYLQVVGIATAAKCPKGLPSTGTTTTTTTTTSTASNPGFALIPIAVGVSGLGGGISADPCFDDPFGPGCGLGSFLP